MFHIFLFVETLLSEVGVRGLAVLKLFFKVVTTVQLQIYHFIQNFKKKEFKGRKNQKQPLELFWEKEMFLKVAALKVARWNLQSKNYASGSENPRFLNMPRVLSMQEFWIDKGSE